MTTTPAPRETRAEAKAADRLAAAKRNIEKAAADWRAARLEYLALEADLHVAVESGIRVGVTATWAAEQMGMTRQAVTKRLS